jgi:Zn finger protein HypA/HybF involved in hydrogenase expression
MKNEKIEKLKIIEIKDIPKLPTLKCQRCEHTWHPRTENIPEVCPKCKSPYWNKPRGKKQ